MIKIPNLLIPNAKRDYIHFAKEYNGMLFTIQEDTTLTIWEITKPFGLEKITEVELGGKFYRPNFQFEGDKLLLSHYRASRIAIIDFKDLDNVTAVTRETTMGTWRGSSIINDKLYTQISSSKAEEFCYEVSDIPSIDNPEPETTLAIATNEIDNEASYAVTVNNTMYWINQDTIYLMDITKPNAPKTIVDYKIGNFLKGYPILLSNNRMLVLEISGDFNFAVNDFDISDTDVKRRGKGLLRNHYIRAWQLIDSTLYIVHMVSEKIDKELKCTTYFSAIDVSDDATIISTKELPIEQRDVQDEFLIRWMYIQDNSFYVFQGNGDIHDFSLEEFGS